MKDKVGACADTKGRFNNSTGKSDMKSDDSLHGRVEELIARSRKAKDIEQREATLKELIELYDDIKKDDEAAQKVREAFLLVLKEEPDLLDKERFSAFLIDHIKLEDLTNLKWKEPHQVVSFAEALYSYPFEDESASEQVRSHISSLMRHVMQNLESRGDMERIFQLLSIAPSSARMADDEILRLRSRAYLYEMQRVRRNRSILFGYLILQVVLVGVVFPFLFINAENGRIRDEIEKVAKVNMPEEGRRYFTYKDGLYWSIITAGSIGYGDITPKTSVGKVIAAILGIMGVVTVGVVAGLILKWITPRSLEL